MAAPYDDLRVIELSSDPAGELTGGHFAHMGADVVKIEPPGGGESRHVGPFARGHDDAEHSLNHWYYNGSKRSVVLDLGAAGGEDRSAFDRLLATADILIS